jgi:segregation and condensation protein B
MADSARWADILEALLLVTDKPLVPERIATVVPDLKPEAVPELVETLNRTYESTGRSFRVRQIAGGYRLYALPEYQAYVEALAVTTREARLSQAGLETLAVVAYRQPVSRGDVEYVRGCDCDGVLRTLLSRKLITIKGRSDAPGRPLLYATTSRFLEYFGLAKIEDLPDWGEIAALVGEPIARTRLTLVRPEDGALGGQVESGRTQVDREFSPSEEEPRTESESETDAVGVMQEAGVVHLPPEDEA